VEIVTSNVFWNFFPSAPFFSRASPSPLHSSVFVGKIDLSEAAAAAARREKERERKERGEIEKRKTGGTKNRRRPKVKGEEKEGRGKSLLREDAWSRAP
jgi:hypothetical protein